MSAHHFANICNLESAPWWKWNLLLYRKVSYFHELQGEGLTSHKLLEVSRNKEVVTAALERQDVNLAFVPIFTTLPTFFPPSQPQDCSPADIEQMDQQQNRVSSQWVIWVISADIHTWLVLVFSLLPWATLVSHGVQSNCFRHFSYQWKITVHEFIYSWCKRNEETLVNNSPVLIQLTDTAVNCVLTCSCLLVRLLTCRSFLEWMRERVISIKTSEKP